MRRPVPLQEDPQFAFDPTPLLQARPLPEPIRYAQEEEDDLAGGLMGALGQLGAAYIRRRRDGGLGYKKAEIGGGGMKYMARGGRLRRGEKAVVGEYEPELAFDRRGVRLVGAESPEILEAERQTEIVPIVRPRIYDSVAAPPAVEASRPRLTYTRDTGAPLPVGMETPAAPVITPSRLTPTADIQPPAHAYDMLTGQPSYTRQTALPPAEEYISPRAGMRIWPAAQAAPAGLQGPAEFVRPSRPRIYDYDVEPNGDVKPAVPDDYKDPIGLTGEPRLSERARAKLEDAPLERMSLRRRLALGALTGLGAAGGGQGLGGALGGAIAGAVAGAASPTLLPRMRRQRQLAEHDQETTRQRAVDEAEQAQRRRELEMGEIERRPEREAETREHQIRMIRARAEATTAQLEPRMQAQARREQETFRLALLARGATPEEAEAEAANMIIARYQSRQDLMQANTEVARANAAAIPRRIEIAEGGLEVNRGRLDETRQHNCETEAQGRARIAQGAGGDSSARRGRAINEIQDFNRIIQRYEEQRTLAATGGSSSERARAARNAEVLADQARRQAALISAEYDDLVEHDEQGFPSRLRAAEAPAVGQNAAPAPAPAAARPNPQVPAPNQQPGGRVSRARFRQQNPRYANSSDAEIDALLRQRGLVGY